MAIFQRKLDFRVPLLTGVDDVVYGRRPLACHDVDRSCEVHVDVQTAGEATTAVDVLCGMSGYCILSVTSWSDQSTVIPSTVP